MVTGSRWAPLPMTKPTTIDFSATSASRSLRTDQSNTAAGLRLVHFGARWLTGVRLWPVAHATRTPTSRIVASSCYGSKHLHIVAAVCDNQLSGSETTGGCYVQGRRSIGLE